MKFILLFLLIFVGIIDPLQASIIKKPPVKQAATPYQELVLTQEDRENVYEIISTIFESGKLNLLIKQSHLREIGARINHLHPLKFLVAIFTEPYLKSCMRYIWEDYFKRNGFLEGLAPSLTREAERGKLDQYLHEFAAELGVKGENVKPYFDSHDWENLVLFLIQS